MIEGNIEKIYLAVKTKEGKTHTFWLDDPKIFPHILVAINIQQKEGVQKVVGHLSELNIPIEDR